MLYRQIVVPDRTRETFWDHVNFLAPGGCWLWTLSVGSHGYGQIWWRSEDGQGHNYLAHRVAWTLTHGDIPSEMTLDHACRVRRCVNPSHLEVVTLSENSIFNGNKVKTHCPQGHAYDDANTVYQRDGSRKCRICRQQRDRQRWSARREAQNARRKEREELSSQQRTTIGG